MGKRKRSSGISLGTETVAFTSHSLTRSEPGCQEEEGRGVTSTVVPSPRPASFAGLARAGAARTRDAIRPAPPSSSEKRPPLLPPPPTRPQPLASLPASLQRLGNAKAWQRLHDHLVRTPHVPVAVWGPTGVGKSCGIAALVKAMGMRIAVFDGADYDSGAELERWVARIRATSSGWGRFVVVLDDLEGFTAPARAAISRHLATSASAPHASSLSPLIVTCTQLRAPEMSRPLAGISDVRLYAPDKHTVMSFFARDEDDAKVVETALRDLCAHGDLRRVHLALRSFRTAEGGARSDLRDLYASCSPFERARLLLQRRLGASDWCQDATDYDVALLQRNVVPDEGGKGASEAKRKEGSVVEMERVAKLLGSFSDADALCARRVGEEAAASAKACVAAQSVAALAPRRADVGALVPPLVSRHGAGAAPLSFPHGKAAVPDSLMGASVLRDVPSALLTHS